MTNQQERDTVLNLFKGGDRLTSTDVALALDFNIGKAKYYLTRLKDDGLLTSHGRGQFGGYSLVVKSPRRRGIETDLKILDLLNAQGPLTSSQIADVLDMTQSAVAQRLHRLQTRGDVVGERNGPNRGYRIPEKTASYGSEGKKLVLKEKWDHEEASAVRENPYKDVKVEVRTVPDPSLEDVQGWMTDLKSSLTPPRTVGETNGNVTHVAVNPDMFDKVKDLPFPVGVAALALLNNDVTTARRMLELA